VTVPPNTTAHAQVPWADSKQVRVHGQGARFQRILQGRAVYELQPGTYELDSPARD
jgi:hypothetical protein